MIRRLILPALLACLLSHCSQSPYIVSKERSLFSLTQNTSSSPGGIHDVSPPSSRIVQASSKKPKDKHGMPLYSGSRERLRYVRTTAYTCSEDDHIQYGSMNAAGTRLRYSDKVRSAAADWSVYPVGTVFRIKGMPQLYVIDDYGSALTGTGTIDLYKPNKATMNKWGRRNVEISIVRWGSYQRSAKLLSGRTAYSHCRQMYVALQRKLGTDNTTASR